MLAFYLGSSLIRFTSSDKSGNWVIHVRIDNEWGNERALFVRPSDRKSGFDPLVMRFNRPSLHRMHY